MGILRKLFLSIIFVLFAVNSFAANRYFYIDYSAGNDSNTVTQAQNPATPWKNADGMLDLSNLQSVSNASWVQTFSGSNIWEAPCYTTYCDEMVKGANSFYTFAAGDWMKTYVQGNTYGLNDIVVGPDGYMYIETVDWNVMSGVWANDVANGYWKNISNYPLYGYGAGGVGTLSMYSTSQPTGMSAGRSAAIAHAGYTSQPGDVFVFKGGVTWPATSFPFNLNNSGASGNPIVYMGGQQCGYTPGAFTMSSAYACNGTNTPCGSTASLPCNGGSPWYTGGSPSYPIFDGANDYGVYDNGFIIGKNTLTYVTLDGLQINNLANSLVKGGDATTFNGTTGVTIKNMYYNNQSSESVVVSCTAGGNALYIYDNFFNQPCHSIFYACGSGVSFDDIQVFNNQTTGDSQNPYQSVWGTTCHHDGYIMGSNSPAASPTITNVKIYNNRMYGDWSGGSTGFIYINGPFNHLWIYNNVLTNEGGTAGTGFFDGGLDINYCSDIHILNNTIDTSQGNSATALRFVTQNNTIEAKNNILVTHNANSIIISSDTIGTVALDYNSYYDTAINGYIWDQRPSVNARCTTLCRDAPFNDEANGLFGSNPYFTTAPTPGTAGSGLWTLSASSPQKLQNGGLNLVTDFTTDYLNVARSGAWSLGAYQMSGADVTDPTVSSVTIPSSGTSINIAMSEPVNATINAAFTITASGGAATLTCVAQSAVNTISCTINRTIHQNETVTLAHTGATVTDLSSNPLLAFSGTSVTNNSTQNTPPNFTLAVTPVNDSILSLPSGINCGSTCSNSFQSGTVITLYPSCNVGYQTPVYSGGCSSSSITLSGDTSCTVTCSLIPPTFSGGFFSGGSRR
jgi:hypothetical protein